MSIGAVVGRLTDAKNKLILARHAGTHAATSIAEAQQLVDGVLDAVADKDLSAALAVHGKAVLDEVHGIDALSKGVDDAIARARGVGGSRR